MRITLDEVKEKGLVQYSMTEQRPYVTMQPSYFTFTPSTRGDGWDDVAYWTTPEGYKKGIRKDLQQI